MKTASSTSGSLPGIIGNTEGLYQGDLKHYFRKVFFSAQNLFHPYHNFRHMMHVLWLCYQACLYYKDKLTMREIRNLLIGAIYHDVNHGGMAGEDDLNIQRALRRLKVDLIGEDVAYYDDIANIIRATEYPYVIATEKLSLSQLIIRDVDVSQAFSPAWIQQVIFGLSREWGIPPIKVLEMQEKFLKSIKFNTEWAQGLFPREVVDQKIEESLQLMALLTESDQVGS
jgi:hypothetical protein